MTATLQLQPDTPRLLQRFNRRWSLKHQNFARWNAPPWWGRGTVISPELRAHYNTFLPPEDFHHDLRLLALHALPQRSLLPTSLEHDSPPPLSIPDWWASLNDTFAGRTSFTPALFPALLCNLADPARMGTDAQRYPDQIPLLLNFIRQAHRPHLSLLDLGCGVGIGTYELASLVAPLLPSATVKGVTLEGLEVWMATRQTLPHDPLRQRNFLPPPPHVRVTFAQGDATRFTDSTSYDLIVCNGLAGGRFLHSHTQLNAFLDTLDKLLAPAGCVLLANRFHDGERPHVQALMQCALNRHWLCAGHWQNLQLTKNTLPT